MTARSAAQSFRTPCSDSSPSRTTDRDGIKIAPDLLTGILQRAAQQGKVRPDRFTRRAAPGDLPGHEILTTLMRPLRQG